MELRCIQSEERKIDERNWEKNVSRQSAVPIAKNLMNYINHYSFFNIFLTNLYIKTIPTLLCIIILLISPIFIIKFEVIFRDRSYFYKITNLITEIYIIMNFYCKN
ncbi:hypothetical protein EDEG_00484 [Edhazardia aedis USNM 41457]|uniref:Uncharacterized protein n=1 Tax=Edhazardia aedis (strain USNM 41457) TaxID=1003232 RepID=J9D166_EDHAE|nr:hypothetical protein EDEG_00484 [Edhazardia aedis USNM 41457]|eukprot:EJW01324.1 hypothetical protein EDEG_00484 [Edhazardia aedis USNM 41457]